MNIYLASPLGFSPETKSYLEKVKDKLKSLGHDVFDPWEQDHFAGRIEQAFRIESFHARVEEFRSIASGIGEINESGIIACDGLLAILDGAEIDSGTAGEVGFASALGRKCYGLRTDIRDCGDFVGIPINLQILRFIERSGGCLFRCIDDIRL
ncbi:nucleoside 2-deoxyribosyltransferase [Geobacter sulfurreducens]|uniref:2'-deoxyribonucleoside glycosidase, putative n=1 Tax=Geobacter sulfurreducens (strain ATCC 51573 / DSM 12127 / PCA) TaxID=243231 RepID=Q74CV5_GEOSL|nr:nucleoside 2-deoxyribosyltransferase [Geobacter sulfurreducens]AAR34940.2 2'-deoxyribonucleoside glycosidase, putative [Geobacter sulfurreducens PCA]ADI84400.1 2'-deoxyribonucleoside glycosidase, putative [Geobacter sulfurreducens KN400]AJY71552.1 2-deoxyribonucleoside glycosidase [Geobacter sulfurreducens]QVW36734.1 nucleoside 2-deoxyribosyltransferase [Geobacter sulfurreducens]UAC05571.1 nucleoside 2-deoxyribosyltransferase [Geobacter sulfurreducens]